MADLIPFVMFLVACLVLMAGYPVAFSLAGTALLFALVGTVTGHFDMAFYKHCLIVYLAPWKILP